MIDFVHLHVHSDNSLLDGYGTIDEYINKAKKYNMKGLALTDHNTLTGIYDFMKKCKQAGIKPICGVEMNIAAVDETGESNAKNLSSVQYSHMRGIPVKNSFTHLTLLAKNKKGLKNLFKLVNISYQPENYFIEPRIDLNILKEYSDNLICLSGCPNSEINARFRIQEDEKAYQTAAILKEIFKDDFYIEIMKFDSIPNYDTKKLLELSRKLKITPVMTNDVHYCNSEDSNMQEKIMALGNNNKMDETPSYKGGLRVALGGNDRYLKSFDEMKKNYNYNKFPNLLHNSMEIFEKIEDIDLEYDHTLRPILDIPEGFSSSLEYLKHLIIQGYKKKRGNASKEVQKISKMKIKEELEIIEANDFVNYFLVVWDYCKWSRDNGYPIGPGRGSCGGSEITFLLDISRTDPIRFGLLFERFISPGRGAIYEIEYEDGTKETLNISEKKKVNGKNRYIHQLEIGDMIDEEN